MLDYSAPTLNFSLHCHQQNKGSSLFANNQNLSESISFYGVPTFGNGWLSNGHEKGEVQIMREKLLCVHIFMVVTV